jgi:heme-degrading monooxygenase HmoA
LERSGGVLFIDRYTSVDRPDVILSHQWWADEESLIRWRAHTQYRAIQRAGREQPVGWVELFAKPINVATRNDGYRWRSTHPTSFDCLQLPR